LRVGGGGGKEAFILGTGGKTGLAKIPRFSSLHFKLFPGNSWLQFNGQILQ
jgi:hypothetical protein